jgi:putative protease
MNSKSREFYIQHGVSMIEPAFEQQAQDSEPLMFMRYCIKGYWGLCPKDGATENSYKEPFCLIQNNIKLKLEFDFKCCKIKVFLSKGN